MLKTVHAVIIILKIVTADILRKRERFHGCGLNNIVAPFCYDPNLRRLVL